MSAFKEEFRCIPCLEFRRSPPIFHAATARPSGLALIASINRGGSYHVLPANNCHVLLGVTLSNYWDAGQ